VSGVVAAAVVATVLAIGGGSTALAAPTCNLVPQLRDVTINQGLGSYSPLAWGKDTLVRLYLSQPSCAPTGALIQVTGGTLTIAGGGVANRTVSSPTPTLVSVFPALATYNTAPAVDSTGDVKFDAPGPTLSPAATAAGFTATFTATLTYSAQASSRTAPTTGSVNFSTRPGTTTSITAPVAKKTNALRVLVVPMGDPTKLYNTQLTASGQAEVQRGMLTLSRIYPLRDGIASLTDTTTTGLAAGLKYSISPTLLNVASLMSGGFFCGNSANFTTLRGLLAQFLQAFNSANPATPADRVLGVGDQAVTKGSSDGCDEGRAAVNGNEAWARLIYDATGAPSRTGALMGMELAHTMGAVPAGRNDGAFHSLYTNADYLPGDLNRAFNIATRSVLAGTNDDHTVMRFVTPWDNTNTVLEKADWGLLLCRLGGPTTSDCATAGTVGSAAAGPAFVMSGTTSGASGICATCVGAAAGTNVVESYFSNSMPQTRPDPASDYHLVQKRNGSALAAPFGNQGVPISSTDTHHDGTSPPSHTEVGLFSVALPFDTSADRIELWKGTPGSANGLLLYARNTSAAPTVTSMTSGEPIVLLHALRASPTKPIAHARSTRGVTSVSRALAATVYTVDSAADPGDGVCDATSCTLRDAILAANGNAGTDTINFNIAPGGLQTIHVGPGGLPPISDPVDIDGTTQPGFVTTPVIELDGSDAAGTGISGLYLNADNSSIRGLVVNHFNSAGIWLQGANDVVAGNFLGTNAAGTAAAGNSLGIVATIGPNTIGGTTAASRNLISGNGSGIYEASTGDHILGNFIGTGANGTTALGNTSDGIFFDHGKDAVVGGTAAGSANVISGNGTYGVRIQGDGNTLQGNSIGTDLSASLDLPNQQAGVQIGLGNDLAPGNNNTIGGTAAGAGNVIQHNVGPGINVRSGTGNSVLSNSIDDNGMLGIDLLGEGVTANDTNDPDTGSNNLQNFPVIESVIDGVITGTLNSESSKTYRIEFFSNTTCDSSDHGEGARFLGATSVTTDGSGNASFTASPPLVSFGDFVTATATDPNGNTSEFSACQAAIVTGDTGGGPYSVNSPNDADDGTCDASHCSLREAINAANAHANGDGADEILFAIVADGPQQIALTSPLPDITEAVVIDGDSERTTGTNIPADTKAIGLSGADAGTSANGLVLAAGSDGSEIKGLAIRRFHCSTAAPDPCTSGFGIDVKSDGNTIDGNYIGLLADGTAPSPNEGGGIYVEGSGNTVGGTTTDERNVVAGNGVPASVRSQILVTGNTNAIKGNYIGAASNGTDDFNEVTGITIQSGAHDNVIGGDKTVGNIILGRQGIDDAGTANVIAGNKIGLDDDGLVHASALGIHASGTGTIIGDNVSPPGFANPDKGNEIVGSSDAGIFMEGASSAKIAGNFVGTNRSGALDIGNADGIRLSGGGNNTVGPGNTFAFNTAYGVDMGSATNRVVANSIHDNGLEGIHNDTDFVTIAPPTLTSAVKSGTNTTVNGTFSGAANTQFFIEFFQNTTCDASGAGEGETYIGFASPTTNGAGSASYSFSSATLNVGDIITATATNASELSTSEFSVCRAVVASTTPPGQQEFDVGGSDDNAHDDLLDLYLDCGPGKGKFPIALALPPASATNTTANWSYNYDASLACEGGQLKAIINDGFRQSGFSNTGTEPVESGQKDPFSAILSPGKGKTILQYSGIPLKGLAVDPEDGALTPQWRLIRDSDSATVRTGSGTTADLSPGTNGWTPGNYTVELKATDSAGKTTTSTVAITIVADADNDGIPASAEGGCLGGSDTNPLDAYGDKDGDGIPNAEDPDPCVPQTGAYTAVMTFQPNPFPIPSSGNTVNVTVQVPYRNLTQVLSSSVAITSINNEVVNFRNVSWKVTNNVGQALFDRQALVSYFMNHNIHNRTVVFTITGSSAAPPWSFKGVATTFVAG
jgi:CSLREA domain-containing protein